MKQYELEYTKKFSKQLKKLDPYQAKLILKWLNKHISHSTNPRWTGKKLKGKYLGMWRYRIGDYRVIVEIQDKNIIVLALTVGHRRTIYK